MQIRIALVTHDLRGGGTGAVTAFVYRVLADSGDYYPEIISLSTSATDTASVLLRRPTTWRRGLQIHSREWNGLRFRHMGAYLSEFEFQRYQPRSVLTKLLNEYDLVQVIAGIPAWGNVTKESRVPVCLQVATRATKERRSLLSKGSIPKRLWAFGMTLLAAPMEEAALRRMDCVFVENSWMFDSVKQRVGPSRVVFAPPGVDTNVFRPSTTTERQKDYILSVGRFSDPRKNVRLLLAAYAFLCQQDASAPRLILAGTPGLGVEDVRFMQKIGIANRIEILTDIEQSELADLYRNAQFFVLSSDEEGLGIVILEAMASGLPVVSTRSGGPETAVVEGKTGFLTPIGDAPALADAMSRLIEDPGLRRRMAEAGRQIIEERFSLATAGKVFLEKYDEILDTRR